MTEKRFTVQSSYLGLYTIFDGKEMKPLSSRDCVDLLNSLNDENEQLKYTLASYQIDLRRYKCKCNELEEENQRLIKVIGENEKLIQSTYDELTKLRCIKENLERIKCQWDWIMGAIQYD